MNPELTVGTKLKCVKSYESEGIVYLIADGVYTISEAQLYGGFIPTYTIGSVMFAENSLKEYFIPTK